ncbi:4-hydroxybenzoate octaprenyltransferase [Hyphococcus luteus]|uniref:4-hydroxybenzoate octaprenyltransferase n=1 Tax=Hyphococcus luteus TaxID=2058213 RepID=A0A2S7K8L9_9PROT|nr:4-hydroxybenzoate octaprenyltransferase [Marinicaulis flavus]PQA88846.1 4-hydroxybenzoate octaprenyltransferase [Marinicaulis flavus]
MTSPAPSAATPDAVPGNWVARAPAFAQPYLRLMRADRPVGTWLLLIPCFWGLALAAAGGYAGFHLLWYAVLMSIGAYAMRGAGCAYNDIVDRDFDAKVERTAARPIPAGQISVKQAWAFLVFLSFIGLAVLLQFNRVAIFVGLGSLALVAAYPFMKRITWWPQAWLGLTFNWGALVGYAAAAGKLDAAAFALYAAGLFWTLFYDTIYAHQDTEDDALIGVKSTALRLGEKTKPALGFFFAMTLVFFALAGTLIHAHWIYYLALGPGAAHFVWQLKHLDIHDNHVCLTLFKSNRDAGLLLLLSPLCELGLSSF